ncbi:MAG: multiprotein-bridging factor 1 family protein [Alphaproteobacteria bacterium]
MAKAKFSPAYNRLRTLLIAAREDAGLRQIDVARKLRRNQSFVSKVESGERRLDVVEFLEFAKASSADPLKIIRAIAKINDS